MLFPRCGLHRHRDSLSSREGVRGLRFGARRHGCPSISALHAGSTHHDPVRSRNARRIARRGASWWCDRATTQTYRYFEPAY
jgi:hypothetical protein